MKRTMMFACSLLLFASPAAFAAPLKNVNCNAGKKIQDVIDNLGNDKDITIDVSGVCNENVVIRNFSGSSLILTSTSGATINDASAGLKPLILVVDSRVVTISKLIVNSPTGIQFSNCFGCNAVGNTLTIARNGIAANNSSGLLFDNTINLSTAVGGGTGVVVASFSNYVLSHNLITGAASPVRPAAGLLVTQSSRAQVNPATGASEITGVNTAVQAEAGSSVQLSGCAPPDATCINLHHNNIGVIGRSAVVGLQSVTVNNNATGVEVFLGGSLSLFNAVVSNNIGNGVRLSDNSSMSISSSTIQSNGSSGITAGNLASVSAGTIANTVTLNNGGVPKDVACDTTSRVTGTNFLVGSVLSCANTTPFPSPLP